MSGNYTAYLLRIWQVGERPNSSWRAMLEDAQTHETIGFTSLEELMAFLQGNHARHGLGDADDLVSRSNHKEDQKLL